MTAPFLPPFPPPSPNTAPEGAVLNPVLAPSAPISQLTKYEFYDIGRRVKVLNSRQTRSPNPWRERKWQVGPALLVQLELESYFSDEDGHYAEEDEIYAYDINRPFREAWQAGYERALADAQNADL